MCEPTTIMLGLAAVGALAGAAQASDNASAQKSSLMYQGAVAENNAKMLEYKAQDIEAAGRRDQILARQQNERLKGQQRATLAARGLSLTEGTPKTLLDQTDYFGEVDQVAIKNNTAKDAWATRVDAQNMQSDSSMLLSRGGSISPGRAGALSLLNSGTSVASSWYRYNEKTPK